VGNAELARGKLGDILKRLDTTSIIGREWQGLKKKASQSFIPADWRKKERRGKGGKRDDFCKIKKTPARIKKVRFNAGRQASGTWKRILEENTINRLLTGKSGERRPRAAGEVIE